MADKKQEGLSDELFGTRFGELSDAVKGKINGRGVVEWLEAFLPLHEKARPVIQKVGKCVRGEDEKAAVEALNEAVQKLPSILQEMQETPNPKDKELKEIRKKFENGFKEFLDSCKYGVTYFDKPTRWNQNVWLATADSAAKKLEEATIRFSRYSNSGISYS